MSETEVSIDELQLILDWIAGEPSAEWPAVRRALRSFYRSQAAIADVPEDARQALEVLYRQSLESFPDREAARAAWSQLLHFWLQWHRQHSHRLRLVS